MILSHRKVDQFAGCSSFFCQGMEVKRKRWYGSSDERMNNKDGKK
jgi:hypothetical protein